MAAVPDSRLHVAMFPWLAFGHMIPFLELSKLLAQKGHKISFISTPLNIDRLPKLPPNLSSSINFVKIVLPCVENLPQNAEATSDLPHDKVPYLKQAYDELRDSLFGFLETSNPDWVIYDFVPFWVPELSKKLGIPAAFFSIFAPFSLTMFEPTSPTLSGIYSDRSAPEEFTVQPKWIRFGSAVRFRFFEIQRIFSEFGAELDSQVSDSVRFFNTMKSCDAIFIRSCREYEPDYLNVLEEIHGKPVIPVGLLPPTKTEPTGNNLESWTVMKEWLDKQENRSVVYIAFGSEAKPSQEELTEIAFGLEMSGLPFFWALRTRRGLADTKPVKLPDGFEERTEGRGLVCTSWAPQLKILSHDSVGACFTHAGWSSVIEAMMNEKPLVLLTFLADQGLNAVVLEENKTGYLIPRDETNGYFTREAVAASLKLVVGQEEGGVYRDKAKEMKGIFGDKHLQDQYMHDFEMYLKTYKKKPQYL